MSSTTPQLTPLPPPCAPEVAESLGLAGLTIYPIPETDLVATINKYAQERLHQLEWGISDEDTLIFTGATTAHINRLWPKGENKKLDHGCIRFFGNKSGLLFIALPTPPPSIPCDPEVAESLGLAGLTVFPIPKNNLAATIHRFAKERQFELKEGLSKEDTLIFHGATTAHVEALHPGGSEKLYPGYLTFFGDKSGLLFIRLPSPVQTSATTRLFLHFAPWVSNMGLFHNSHFTGPLFSHKDAVTEPAHGIQPVPARRDIPTLVIETASSHPRLSPKYKDFWFNISPPDSPEGDVKVVITISVYSQPKRLVVEEWQRNSPTPTQSVLIKVNPETGFSPKLENAQTHWIVEGGPLRIKFEDVFLRSKRGQESDFVLGEQDLRMLALHSWSSSTD